MEHTQVNCFADAAAISVVALKVLEDLCDGGHHR